MQNVNVLASEPAKQLTFVPCAKVKAFEKRKPELIDSRIYIAPPSARNVVATCSTRKRYFML